MQLYKRKYTRLTVLWMFYYKQSSSVFAVRDSLHAGLADLLLETPCCTPDTSGVEGCHLVACGFLRYASRGACWNKRRLLLLLSKGIRTMRFILRYENCTANRTVHLFRLMRKFVVQPQRFMGCECLLAFSALCSVGCEILFTVFRDFYAFRLAFNICIFRLHLMQQSKVFFAVTVSSVPLDVLLKIISAIYDTNWCIRKR